MLEVRLQSPLVYRHSSILGIDIGSHSAKLAQVKKSGKGIEVLAYAHTDFPAETIVEGVVVDPDNLAKALRPILESKDLKFSAKRAATALPVAKVFTRTLVLPPMEHSDMAEAVRLEAEQSIPVPPTDLYLDHEIIGTTKTAKGDVHTNVLMVAAPRAIVDSYVKLFSSLGLEIAAVELGLMSIARSLQETKQLSGPALIIDFGSVSTDLAVFDQVIRLTGSVAGGGDHITASLVKELGITAEQANEIKFKFGIGPSGLQQKVLEVLAPLLKNLMGEINKAMKYYQDRNPGRSVSQFILAGGGAGMPGLSEYLTQNLKGVTVTKANPWNGLVTKHVKAPPVTDTIYTTVLGLALLEVAQ